jgi:hypothetical protein
MQTFKNKNFTKRDYECSNLVYCVADVAPNDMWVPTSESIGETMVQLYRIDDDRYYGWL